MVSKCAPMKVIVSGSRSITSGVHACINRAIEEAGWGAVDLVVSGGAEGVDERAEDWAKEQEIPCYILPAEWEENGKAAGAARNAKMAEIGDALIAIWDGSSKGTRDMMRKAHTEGLPIFLVNLGDGTTQMIDPTG